MRKGTGLVLSLVLLSDSLLYAAPSRATKRTLAKAKEIAAQHWRGGQVMWGESFAVVEDVRLPVPVVHTWDELNKHAQVRKGHTRLRNLRLKIALLDTDNWERGTRKLVNLTAVNDLLDNVDTVTVGEVVAFADPRGRAEWLIARTLSTDEDWRMVLVEMQVLAEHLRGEGKEAQAIEPYLQLVHENDLLFRD